MYKLAFSIFLLFLASNFAVAQNVDEKLFERKSLKSIEKSIKKMADSGYIPMDVVVTPKGRKATFSARLQKPAKPFPWYAELELTDKQFEKHYQEYRDKQMRLIAHEQYTVKKENLHACIWHFDPKIELLSEDELKPEAPRPKPMPLGIIWEPDSRIPSVGTQGGPWEPFENRVFDYMRATQVPAISVAFAIKGRPVYQAAFGLSDARRKNKVNIEHAFRTAWFSRAITAIATLKLVDNGALKLDQPVYPLLGIKPWREATVDARINKVTVLQLLQQTSGHDPDLSMEPTFSPRTVAEKMGLKETITPDQVISYMMSQPLAYEPGTKRVSSAYSFFLLGRVIEKVSGMPYENFVLEHIAKPAGLSSFRMSQTDPEKHPDIAVSHYSINGGFNTKLAGKDVGHWVPQNEGGWHFGLLDSSYGWMSTPMDMLAFGSALQDEEGPLLSEAAKRILVAMPAYQQTEPNADKLEVWNGMGIRVRKFKTGMSFWMESRGVSSTNSIVCFPSGNLRCYMMNCDETIGGDSTTKTFGPIAEEGLDVGRKLFIRK